MSTPTLSAAESQPADWIYDYLIVRRKTIEASIAAERLAGNGFKEACEKTALAEITALEIELSRTQPAITRELAEALIRIAGSGCEGDDPEQQCKEYELSEARYCLPCIAAAALARFDKSK